MKLVGIIGTALLSLILAAPVYAQEQHDQDEQKDQKEQTAKPAQDEKKAETEKSAKQDEKGAQQDKNAKPERKTRSKRRTPSRRRKARSREQGKQEEKNAQQQHAQPAKNAGAHSCRSLQGQLWTRTHVSSYPRRLQQSPLPIRWLLVRIRRPLAEQLALHATGFCGRHRWRVLPLQPDVSRRQC